MRRLLVNAPSGEQQIIELGEGGGYFEPARVVHDEAVDGPLPEATVKAVTAASAAAAATRATRADVDAKLAALDQKTIRALRDAALGIVGADGKTGAQRLADYEAQAAVLRAARP